MKTIGLASLALAVALAACSGGSDGAASSCAELQNKDICIARRGCAWGTGRDGPGCFYVGDVKPLDED
jgi:hypothetical protein